MSIDFLKLCGRFQIYIDQDVLFAKYETFLPVVLKYNCHIG